MLKDKFKRLKIDKGHAATCDTFEVFLCNLLRERSENRSSFFPTILASRVNAFLRNFEGARVAVRSAISAPVAELTTMGKRKFEGAFKL